MKYEQDSSSSYRSSDIADEETLQVDASSFVSQEPMTVAVPEANDAVFMVAMQQLIKEMQLLREEFSTKIKYDESKERQIDSLHKELQVYRAGLHFKILRPVILDLISMHDDLSRLIESIPRAESMIPIVQVLKNLESFQITIEEILKRNGIEPYSIEGESFVSGKQRSLQAIETAESSLDKQIARRVRKGFEDNEKILRPELVITYRTTSLK